MKVCLCEFLWSKPPVSESVCGRLFGCLFVCMRENGGLACWSSLNSPDFNLQTALS